MKVVPAIMPIKIKEWGSEGRHHQEIKVWPGGWDPAAEVTCP